MSHSSFTQSELIADQLDDIRARLSPEDWMKVLPMARDVLKSPNTCGHLEHRLQPMGAHDWRAIDNLLFAIIVAQLEECDAKLFMMEEGMEHMALGDFLTEKWIQKVRTHHLRAQVYAAVTLVDKVLRTFRRHETVSAMDYYKLIEETLEAYDRTKKELPSGKENESRSADRLAIHVGTRH